MPSERLLRLTGGTTATTRRLARRLLSDTPGKRGPKPTRAVEIIARLLSGRYRPADVARTLKAEPAFVSNTIRRARLVPVTVFVPADKADEMRVRLQTKVNAEMLQDIEENQATA